MSEHEVFIEEEFTTDVDVDFSTYDDEEKLKIIEAIINNKTFTFEQIYACFSKDVTVNIDEGAILE